MDATKEAAKETTKETTKERSEEQKMIDQLQATGRYRILKQVPTRTAITELDERKPLHRAMILDLETMGLDAQSDKIIELGLLCFTFSSDGTLYEVTDTLNQLQDPGEPIPDQVTQITGISDADVAGKMIDWDRVLELLVDVDLCIAHNAAFDRAFMEGPHVPTAVREEVMRKPFACSQKDVDWRERGFEAVKLDYLNFRLGYFYGGHRALNDCEATLNILLESSGAFAALLQQVRQPTYLIVALNAPFDKKDLLKQRSYRWSTGEAAMPKGWYTLLTADQLEEEHGWLNETIYKREGHAESLPNKRITAHVRYSPRADRFEIANTP